MAWQDRTALSSGVVSTDEILIKDASDPTDNAVGTVKRMQAGVLMPGGGTTGQVLKKTSPSDYVTAWQDESAGGIAVDDEGGQVLATASRLNFTGTGVTASDGGSGSATINIPGSAGGASYTRQESGGVAGRTLLSHVVEQGINVRDFGALGTGAATTINEWLVGGSQDRGYASLAAIQADYGSWVGSLSLTIDFVAIQRACDLATAASPPSSKVYLPAGKYMVNETIQVTRGVTNFETVELHGEVSLASSLRGTRIDATAFLDRPVLAISGGRNVQIWNLSIEGGNTAPTTAKDTLTTNPANWLSPGVVNDRYRPYCAIAIDPYHTSGGAGTEYPTPTGTTYGTQNLSSVTKFHGLFIRGFAVGIMVTPCATDAQGDYVQIEQCKIDSCFAIFASGGTQNRGIFMTGSKIEWAFYGFDTVSYGLQNGNLPYVRGSSMVRFVKLLNCNANESSGVIADGRIENFHSLGNWETATGIAQPLLFRAMTFTFGGVDPASGGSTTIMVPRMLETSAPVTFDTCEFYPFIFMAPNPGILNFIGTHAEAQIAFRNCYLHSKYSTIWSDRLYIRGIGCEIEFHNCSWWALKYTDLVRWDTVFHPYGQNTHERRATSLPARIEANDYTQSTRLVSGAVQLFVPGNRAPTSGASGYSHAVADTLTFTASTETDFVALADGSGVPGDILFWRDIEGNILPMLRVTGISGATVTCQKLFSDDQYDTGYAPGSVTFFPRQWAPGATLTASGSGTSWTLSASGVVEPGDWITNGSAVARVANVAGTSMTLRASASLTGPLYWGRLFTISTSAI